MKANEVALETAKVETAGHKSDKFYWDIEDIVVFRSIKEYEACQKERGYKTRWYDEE